MERETELLKHLKSVFGYDSFRLDQRNIIHSILDSQDTVGVMPTGGGKSLCYQLPAVYLDGVCLVISPLIALMEDQVANLSTMGISSAFLNSSLTPEERQNVEARLLDGRIKILFLAPEGILNFRNLDLLKKIELSFIAIDEAHCVSQWGHEFRGDYTRLNELRRHFPNLPILALTATADENTRNDIISQLDLRSPQIFVSGFDRPNIRYMIYERTDEISQLHRFIQESHQGDTGIIYCLSRKKVDKVCEKLCEMGYQAISYHAGMSSKDRTRAQKRFKSEDGILVVATIAFGMGIDRPDVRFVAHLDLPKSIEGYYQETGRAGRDGKPASAWMIYGLVDVIKHGKMLELSEAPDFYKRVARVKLDNMLSLCEETSCRRQKLLSYFESTKLGACGNCDTCLEEVPVYDGTQEAQKLMSTIYRTGQIFGANHVIDVLRGSKNAKIQELGHESLSVYGIGAELSKNEWNAVLRQLLNKAYVFIKDYEYRSLALSKDAGKVFRGEEAVELRRLRVLKSKASKYSKSSGKEIALHQNPELFENLRQLRRSIAQDSGIAPYLIFSDKSLHDMCNILPTNKETMLMVHGVGEAKYEKYGEGFLDVVKKYQQDTSI